jgi:hypothetical protein
MTQSRVLPPLIVSLPSSNDWFDEHSSVGEHHVQGDSIFATAVLRQIVKSLHENADAVVNARALRYIVERIYTALLPGPKE